MFSQPVRRLELFPIINDPFVSKRHSPWVSRRPWLLCLRFSRRRHTKDSAGARTSAPPIKNRRCVRGHERSVLSPRSAAIGQSGWRHARDQGDGETCTRIRAQCLFLKKKMFGQIWTKITQNDGDFPRDYHMLSDIWRGHPWVYYFFCWFWGKDPVLTLEGRTPFCSSCQSQIKLNGLQPLFVNSLKRVWANYNKCVI